MDAIQIDEGVMQVPEVEVQLPEVEAVKVEAPEVEGVEWDVPEAGREQLPSELDFLNETNVEEKQEARKPKDEDVLSLVFLMDADKGLGDEVRKHPQYCVYDNPMMRKSYSSIGRDLAEAWERDGKIREGFSHLPQDVAQGVIDGMEDVKKREKWQKEYNNLKMEVGDAPKMYYALLARMQEEGVRDWYENVHLPEKQRNEELRAEQEEALMNPGSEMSLGLMQNLKNLGTLERVEKVRESLKAVGYGDAEAVSPVPEYEDLAKVLRLIGDDEEAMGVFLNVIAQRSQKEAAEGKTGMWRQMAESVTESVVQGVQDSLEHGGLRYQMAGNNLNELLDKEGSENLVSYLENGGMEEWMQMDEKERQALEQELRNAPRVQAQEVAKVAALRQKIREAKETGRAQADAAGQTGMAASTRRTVGAGMGAILPWLGSGVAGGAMKGLAVLGIAGGALGEKSAEAESKGIDDMTQAYKASMASATGETVGMMVGAPLIKAGVGRLLPGLGKVNSAIGMKVIQGGFTGTLANFGAGTLRTAIDFGVVIPTATALAAGITNYTAEVDPELGHAWEDWLAHFKEYKKADKWGAELVQSAMLAALHIPDVKRATRAQMDAIKDWGRSYEMRGGKPEVFEEAKRKHGELNARAVVKECEADWEKEMREHPVETIARGKAALKAEINKAQAANALADNATKQALARFAKVEAETLENGKVRVWLGVKVDADGKIERGERYEDVDPDVAERYLGTLGNGIFEDIANATRDFFAGRLSIEEFKRLYEEKGLEAREELLPKAQSLDDMRAMAEQARIRKQEIAAGDESKLEAAGKVIDPKLSSELTLDALIELPKYFENRGNTEAERGGSEKPITNAYVVPVTMGDGTTRYVLRHTKKANFFALSEELGEQAMLNYIKVLYAGGKREEVAFPMETLARDLLDMRAWMRESEKYKKAADKWFGISEQLEGKLRNKEVLTVAEGRQLEDSVVEAMSTLFRSGMVGDAMTPEGNLPGWMRPVISACAEASTHAPEYATIGGALRELEEAARTSPEGVQRYQETVNKLMQHHRDVLERMFKEYRDDPTAEQIAKMEEEVQRAQNEQNARVGRGVSIAPEETERGLADFNAEQQANAQADAVDEAEAQADENAAREDIKSKPGNDGMSEEEVTRERTRSFAEAQEERIANDPAAQEDAAGIFMGGKYTPVQAEGFGDVQQGMVPVALISLGTEGTPRGANYEGMRIGSDAHYRPNHEPIYLWQRANGELLVIDGHNRLLRAKLAGADSINAYVFTETEERTEQWARAKYYEKNVREHKASVKEVAWFVSGANIHGRQLTAEELAEYGLNEEQSNKVRIGIMLGRYGAPEVLDALFDRPGEYEFEEDVLARGGISLADAVRIVEYAKGDRDVQLEGLRALRGEADENGVYGQGRNIEAARRVMQLFLVNKANPLYGEIGEVEAERTRHFLRWLADYQGRKLKEVEEDIALLEAQGLTKELMEKYGIDRQQGGNEEVLTQLRNEAGMWRMLSVGDWESDRLKEVREAYAQEFGGEEEVKQRYVEDALATMQSYKRRLKTPDIINSLPEEKIKEYHGATKKMKYAGARAEVHEWLNEMRAKYARKAAAWRKAYKAMHEEKDREKQREAQKKIIELGAPLLEEARARGYIWEYGDPHVSKQIGDARVGAYIAGAIMGDRKLHFESQLWEFANYKGKKPGLKKKYDDAFFAKWTTDGIDESMKMLKNPDFYEREKIDEEYKKSKRAFFENYAEEKIKELQAEEERLRNEGIEEGGISDAEEVIRRQQEMWQHPAEHDELLDEAQRAYSEETGEQMWLNEGINEAGERVRNVHFSTDEAPAENQKADNGLLGKAWEDAQEGKETERPNLRRCHAQDKTGKPLDKDTLITTPLGSLNWFEFPQDDHTQGVLKKKGIKDLPIRLKVGKHEAEHRGYGWMHVLNHYEDMQTVGESPLLFMYNTLTNLTRMEGRGGARYTLGAQKDYNEGRVLVVDLMEDDGCYSIVTCYPASAPNQYAGSGLLVGRALFRLSDSNSQNRMESRHRINEVATGTEGTIGKAKAESNLTQEAPSVNIYDVEVVNENKQLVYSQPKEPRAHFSLGGERAATYGEMEAAGLAYYDPADGKRKFALPTAGVRLKENFTPGELNVPDKGHKDVSLAALLHYPELFRAYPELGNMRVRLYKEKGTGVRGFYAPNGTKPKEGAYIALNMAHGTDPERVLNTLLHESQHAIQHHEGWARGAGDMDRKGALKYVRKAMAERKKQGLESDWAKENMSFLTSLHTVLMKGKGQDLQTAITAAYWLSHGEQEARYAGERMTETEGGVPRVTGVAASTDTIAVLPDKITELGGITFGNAGIYARLMESRLAPVGDFQTDRRLYQIRESAVRYARLLNGFTKSEDKTGESLLLEAQGVAERAVSLLPNEYRVGLEPYRVWLSVFAEMSKGGFEAAARASAMVPMRGWGDRIYRSIGKQIYSVFSGRVPEREMEFWLEREESRKLFEQAREMYNEAKEKAKAAGAVGQGLYELTEIYLTKDARYHDVVEKLIGELGKVKTEKVLAKLLERVKHQLDAYRKDKTLGAMRKAVAAAYPVPGKGGKPVKGKMNADSYRALEDYMALLELTEGEQAMFERERYTGEGKEKAWADLEEGDLVTVDVWNEDGEKRVITCTKMEYETYACYERMTPEQAEAAARALGEFITTGKQAWENKQEAQKRQVTEWCRDILDEFDTSENARRAEAVRNEGVLPGRRWFLNLTSWTMNPAQIFDVLAHVPGLQTFARHVGSRIERAEVQLQQWEKERLYRTAEIMRDVCGVKGKKELRQFIDDMNLTRESGIELIERAPDFLRQESEVLRRQFLGLLHRKMRQKNFNANTFAAAFEELVKDELMPDFIAEEAEAKYGAVGDAKKSRLHGVDAVFSLLTRDELNKFYDLRKETVKRAKKAEEKWLKEKEEKKAKLEESGGKMRRSHGGEVLQLTKGEAAYRVLLAEQPAYTEMLRQQGYTEEVVQQLREFAGEKVMNLAYALRAELAKRTPEMKALYEKMYGMPFPEEENYFRAFFDVGQETTQRTLGERSEGKASGGGKIYITYTRHQHHAKVDPTMNLLTAYLTVQKQQDVLLAYRDLPQKIQGVLAHQEDGVRMSAALERVVGRGMVTNMRTIAEHMQAAAGEVERVGRDLTNVIDSLGSAAAHAVLNGRVASNMKQFTALFNTLAGSDNVSLWEWEKSKSRVLAGLGVISMREMAERPELASRFKGWEAAGLGEAMFAKADEVTGHGATASETRAGMSFMEKLDVWNNVKSSCILYDAVYRKMKKENPGLTHEELDAAAMDEVRHALAMKSQPQGWRTRSLLATKRSIFSVGNLFLGGESINTFANTARLLAEGRYGRAAAVWFAHGAALQALTFLYNWLTDDEEQWKRRSWKQYAMGVLAGPFMSVPVVGLTIANLGNAVGGGWVPTQNLLPGADLPRLCRTIKSIFSDKKKTTWMDKTIAVNDVLRTVAMGALIGKPKSVGHAKVQGVAMATTLVSNLLDFVLRTTRAASERW